FRPHYSVPGPQASSVEHSHMGATCGTPPPHPRAEILGTYSPQFRFGVVSPLWSSPMPTRVVADLGHVPFGTLPPAASPRSRPTSLSKKQKQGPTASSECIKEKPRECKKRTL